MFKFTNLVKSAENNQAITLLANPTHAELIGYWKSQANKKEISSADMATLCLYRSVFLKEDIEQTINRIKKLLVQLKTKEN